jgi:hypothetical protein
MKMQGLMDVVMDVVVLGNKPQSSECIRTIFRTATGVGGGINRDIFYHGVAELNYLFKFFALFSDAKTRSIYWAL